MPPTDGSALPPQPRFPPHRTRRVVHADDRGDGQPGGGQYKDTLRDAYTHCAAHEGQRRHLCPGNDVVDWVGLDSYLNAQPGGYHNGDFNYLMNRTTDTAKLPGWYDRAATLNKPIMVAEWAVYECKTTCSPTERPRSMRRSSNR